MLSHLLRSNNAALLRFAVFCFAAVCVFLSGNIKASADSVTGAYSTGGYIPDYASSTEVSVTDDYKADKTGKKDSASAIQKALNLANKEADDSHCVTVRIPAGTYKISKTLKIYSNTKLVVDENATILRSFHSGALIRNAAEGGGYGGDHNILIDGGIWDGNTSEYNAVTTFSNIRIGHANNVVLRNMTVLNNKNGHHMEIGGVQGLTVEGCYFSGYMGSLLKEAIQLDVMNSAELFTGFEPFDDTPCDNVIIQNCTFRSLPRAIGSHSAVVGKYYTNVTIRNNTFSDISNICMVLYNYRDCTVTGNTITDSGAGITFNYMSDEDFKHYFYPLSGFSNAKSNITDNANTLIDNNSITVKQTTLQYQPFAIKIFGKYVSSDTNFYPASDYKVSNVQISSNTIRTANRAISMQNVYDSVISGNDISINSESGSIECDLIYATYCYGIDFKENKITDSLKSALRTDDASDITVKGNTFSDNTELAVIMKNTSDSAVSKNTVKNSGTGGIKAGDGCSKLTVSGNIIKKFGDYAVQTISSGGEKDIKIKSNDISGGSVGISVIKNGKAYLSGNSFEAVEDKVYAESDGMVTLVKPKNFTAEEVTDDRIKLTWNAVSEADGICVYRRKAGSPEFELIATIDSGSIYQDEKLIPGTNYFYKTIPFISINEQNLENTPSDEIEARTKINIETSYVDCVDRAGFTTRPITPEVTIIANNKELTEGMDYDIKYDNNISTGNAVVTITGRGNYIGSVSHSFEIAIDADKVSSAFSRKKSAVSAFSVQKDRKYSVSCTPASVTLLADGGKPLTLPEISLNAKRIQVPVNYRVSTAVWENGSFEYIGY